MFYFKIRTIITIDIEENTSPISRCSVTHYWLFNDRLLNFYLQTPFNIWLHPRWRQYKLGHSPRFGSYSLMKRFVRNFTVSAAGDRQTSCKSKFGNIFYYITEHPNRIMGNILLFKKSIFLKNKSHYGEKFSLLVNNLISLTYNSITFINKITIINIMQCLTDTIC